MVLALNQPDAGKLFNMSWSVVSALSIHISPIVVIDEFTVPLALATSTQP